MSKRTFVEIHLGVASLDIDEPAWTDCLDLQQNPEQHCSEQHWPRGYTISIGSKNFRATLIFSELHCFYIWQEASRELIFDVREYFIKEKVGIKVLSSDGLYKMKL